MKIFMFSCNVMDEKTKEDNNWCYLDTQEKEKEMVEVCPESQNRQIIEQYFLEEPKESPMTSPKTPVSPKKLELLRMKDSLTEKPKSLLLDGEKIELKVENVGFMTNTLDDIIYGELLITDYQIIFQIKEEKPLETSMVEKLTKVRQN